MPDDRPNIVVVLLDTLRCDYVGAYGSQWCRTPNIDRLAARGVTFQRALCGSSPCIPARYDMWTGRYQFPFRGWSPLLPAETAFPELLGQAGYLTMLITDNYPMVDGGWSIQRSFTDASPLQPTPQPGVPGFASAGNYTRGFAGWHFVRGYQTDRHWPMGDQYHELALPFDPAKARAGEYRVKQYLMNVAGRRYERDWTGPRTFQAAMDWLQDNRKGRFPFFLWIDSFTPHEPFDPPRFYEELYGPDYQGQRVILPEYGQRSHLTDEELQHVRALYAGQVTMIDRWFGMLLDQLEMTGLMERTVLVLLSDHGYNFGEHGWVGKPWQANLYYRPYCHIPLIVWDPQRPRGPRRTDDLAQPVDLFPSFLEWAGVQVPQEGHGRSLVPIVRGQPAQPREYALWGWHGSSLGVTDGRWTLHLQPFEQHDEPGLYDLHSDPDERHNLWNNHPHQVVALRQLAAQWLQRIQAPSIPTVH